MWVLFLFLVISPTTTLSPPPPHIILIIADDQSDDDASLATAMPRLTQHIVNAGTRFRNSFVTSPICCVSRASLLTGRYAHNTRVRNNTRRGNCYGRRWRSRDEHQTIATRLSTSNQYVTFYAGKYLNTYHGLQKPPGWHWWYGLEGNSRYYNYSLVVNGTSREWHGDQSQDYLTDMIRRKAVDFIDRMVGSHRSLFMVLAPPAPHAPFTPAQGHRADFANVSAPRTAAFNRSAANDKHWLVAVKHPLSARLGDHLDDIYRNRWRTLASIDDLVGALVDKLEAVALLNDTYIIYTSDNGFHLGEFRLPTDKRQPYEFDVRVPLIMRGPRVPAGTIVNYPALNIDLTPTIAQLAGLDVSPMDDGESLVDALMNGNASLSRAAFLIEYWGEWNQAIESECQTVADRNEAQCTVDIDCACNDARNNTYECVRRYAPDRNDIYCRFADTVRFGEYYDLHVDGLQLTNAIGRLNASTLVHLDRALGRLRTCRGRKQCSQEK